MGRILDLRWKVTKYTETAFPPRELIQFGKKYPKVTKTKKVLQSRFREEYKQPYEWTEWEDVREELVE